MDTKTLEKLQRIYDQADNFGKGLMEKEFPELKESKDERIKRCIRMCLTDATEQRFEDFNTTLKDCLSWLEKQSEQKSIWSEEDEEMFNETLYFINEYQKSDKCKDENGMQNSVSCKKWLHAIKNRLTYEQKE